jgi:hypothetical protein
MNREHFVKTIKMSFFALQKTAFLTLNSPVGAKKAVIWELTKLVLSTVES